MSRQINYKPRVCEKCKKIYIPSASTQKWCQECLIKPCLYCGKPFSVGKKSKYDTSLYCSVECRGKYQSEFRSGENSPLYKQIKTVCANCGKEINKAKRFVDKFEHSFCDRECQIEFYRKEENKLKGKNNPHYTKITKICEWCHKPYEVYKCNENKSRFCSKECLNSWHSQAMRGENHHNWKGGVSESRQVDMSRKEYKEWRNKVFERDDYTCQCCGDNKGGNLEAHHLDSYDIHEEERYDIQNGTTLCETCHKAFHDEYGYGNNTKNQYEEFINNFNLDIQSELTI